MGSVIRRVAAEVKASAVRRYKSFEDDEGSAGVGSFMAADYVSTACAACPAPVQFRLIDRTRMVGTPRGLLNRNHTALKCNAPDNLSRLAAMQQTNPAGGTDIEALDDPNG